MIMEDTSSGQRLLKINAIYQALIKARKMWLTHESRV
jgi:hypothetical protein